MAHWDKDRDKRRLDFMRCYRAPKLRHLTKNFAKTGDLIYWDEFVTEISKNPICPFCFKPIPRELFYAEKPPKGKR